MMAFILCMTGIFVANGSAYFLPRVGCHGNLAALGAGVGCLLTALGLGVEGSPWSSFCCAGSAWYLHKWWRSRPPRPPRRRVLVRVPARGGAS